MCVYQEESQLENKQLLENNEVLQDLVSTISDERDRLISRRYV